MKAIVQNGDPVLRTVCPPVPEELFGTPELQQIITEMEESLDSQVDGVALAAPQIGISQRIFVVRYDRMLPRTEEIHPKDFGVFINPEFVKTSRRVDAMEEGCLSVRGLYGTTVRHERATVRARTQDGGTFMRGAGGILAQAFQHEIDHLDGILFIDHAVDVRETLRPTDHA